MTRASPAVSAAAERSPDAILLDMLMPGLDGVQTLGGLRANQLTREIPVVMLSASLRDEQRALDAGARYFLHKPYHGKEGVSTVRAAMESAGPCSFEPRPTPAEPRFASKKRNRIRQRI